ncbi:DUF4153 domain-containing protein [Ornithinibacillus scapharcae]|uniref:DUF4153 domain-containing protein n=1 Tax=Ornithinibacillus scapharcae TaxID=1147159 RepID=UPI000225AB5A|nr:DUF4173 domain-containing protein [Ornithinibacillus scapharcae]
MEERRKTLLFLVICLILGGLAEVSLLHGVIGVSYPLFIAVFYAVLYFRFGFKFTHRRIGLLLMIVIWLLSASYMFFDNELFYVLNMLAIPVLIFVHIVLITTPNHMDWISIPFFLRLVDKFSSAIMYGKRLTKLFFKRVLFRKVKSETTHTLKKIVLGMLVGSPILFFVTILLVSADEEFRIVIMEVPEFIVKFNFIEILLRSLAALLLSLLFFSVFQVLKNRYVTPVVRVSEEKIDKNWDGIVVGTILILLNGIYVLFVAIQFKYFFGEAIQENLTYAEYARRGFFELLIVTLINWSILLACIKLAKVRKKSLGYFLKGLYSLLIANSSIILTSAYMRLSEYESAYGFTMDRVLAHIFMVFLMVIFAYTFIRVWLEGISLSHFYLIAGLIFYTGLNVVDLEEIIVGNNLNRFEETGKIDVHYLNNLSYSGINGLITLYEIEPTYPELRLLLVHHKEKIADLDITTWQSFNFKKQQVVERLRELEL